MQICNHQPRFVDQDKNMLRSDTEPSDETCWKISSRLQVNQASGFITTNILATNKRRDIEKASKKQKPASIAPPVVWQYFSKQQQLSTPSGALGRVLVPVELWHTTMPNKTDLETIRAHRHNSASHSNLTVECKLNTTICSSSLIFYNFEIH